MVQIRSFEKKSPENRAFTCTIVADISAIRSFREYFYRLVRYKLYSYCIIRYFRDICETEISPDVSFAIATALEHLSLHYINLPRVFELAFWKSSQKYDPRGKKHYTVF